MSATSQLTVVGYACEWIPLELKMTAPAHGLVRTPLLINYHLYNRSQQLLQLDVAMEASEAFMYAGYKQVLGEIFGVKVVRSYIQEML